MKKEENFYTTKYIFDFSKWETEMKYLLRYKDKTEDGREGIIFKEFKNLFQLVGFIYDMELNDNNNFEIFEQKKLNISLENLEDIS